MRSGPLEYEHGLWLFVGAEFSRKTSKWRRPTGECSPKSVRIKANHRNMLIPRSTERWRKLYPGRASVEHEFGRLKNDCGLTALRVRGIERVALHVDLVMLARLSRALAQARAVSRRLKRSRTALRSRQDRRNVFPSRPE